MLCPAKPQSWLLVNYPSAPVQATTKQSKIFKASGCFETSAGGGDTYMTQTLGAHEIPQAPFDCKSADFDTREHRAGLLELKGNAALHLWWSSRGVSGVRGSHPDAWRRCIELDCRLDTTHPGTVETRMGPLSLRCKPLGLLGLPGRQAFASGRKMISA